MLRIIRTQAAVTAAIPARGGYQKHLDAFGCIFCQCAAHPEGFIIGMGQHGHESKSLHWLSHPIEQINSDESSLESDAVRLPGTCALIDSGFQWPSALRIAAR